MKFVNLTPHAISVVDLDGNMVTIEASGSIARVSVEMTETAAVGGFRRRSKSYGEVEGLPLPQDDVCYVVSGIVAERAGRSDVVAPDTGVDAIRNEKGHIVAVRGFV